MEVRRFVIKEVNETIRLVLQKLVKNNIEIRDVEDSTINWTDYIFKADHGNEITNDLTWLSKLRVDSQQLEVESQDSLVRLTLD